MDTTYACLTIAGLTAISALTRSFFLLSEREIPLPDWLRRGLRYAPLAALAAVVAPEVLLDHGALIGTLKDARLYAVMVATAYFFWRRDLLGTIVSGMLVLVPLKVGLGW